MTLCDPETPVFLGAGRDTEAVRAWITFQTGAPLVDAPRAMFAFGAWGDLPLPEFSLGSAEYPDRSATLIVEVGTLENEGQTLPGPGIAHEARLSLPETEFFGQNRQLFPLGLDFIFTSGSRLAALPRSTRVG